MLRRTLRVSEGAGDLRIPANQVGVKVAGSIWTRTSDIARPSLSSAAEVAYDINEVFMIKC